MRFARYAAPLVLLSLVVFVPYLWIAWHVPRPGDAAGVRAVAKHAWLMLAYVAVAQLWLVGAAAAVLGRTQLRALGAGARQLVRAALPLGLALLAIVAGSLALVLPGLALLALFSLVAACEAPGLPGPLLESAERVRGAWQRVLPTLVAIAVADTGLTYAAIHFGFPNAAAKGLTADQLAMATWVLRGQSFALALLSPIAAAALAAIYVPKPVVTPVPSDTPPDEAPAPPAEEPASPALPG